jgi:glycosyltransferase involved in cell wall biosynthesis
MTAHPWRKAFALKFYQGGVFKRAAAIQATSDLEADNLRRLRLGSAPVFIVPNIIREPAAEDLAGCDAVARPERVMLFLSRIHPKKGLDILLDAWNRVRPNGWRLLIVGSGETGYLETLRRFCTAHAVPRVEFKPHVDGKAKEQLFRSASVFVLPTYSENFGNVIAEALIRSVPVITTTGTPWSQIAEKQCGWYIEPRVEDLKRAIAEAASMNSSALSLMGAAGRQYAQATFTPTAVSHTLWQMYQATMRPA